MKNKLLLIQESVTTWREAVSACAKALYKNGYVDATFEEACIAREEKFPTGLAAEVGVAIPHTTADHVLMDGICLLRLERPVSFQRMDDPDLGVDVSFVFNLAVSDSKEQISTLRAVMRLLQNGDFMRQCENMPLTELHSAVSNQILSKEA